MVLSGSAQFAGASILGAGGGVGAATLAAVFVNARFLPMGLALAPSLVGGRLRRAAEGQLVIDASWALANRGDGTFKREYLIGATLPSGVTLGYADCAKADVILGKMRFEMPRPRTSKLTLEHVGQIRQAAHSLGLGSVALAPDLSNSTWRCARRT